MMPKKKRYEYIWEGGRMRVFEYDGYQLCHEYRGYPVSEGYSILLVPCEGGYISREHPYSRKWVSCLDAIKIEAAPFAIRRNSARSRTDDLQRPAKLTRANAANWEQIKLF